MPINDPIRRQKVAPGSLAFERRRSGGGTFQVSEDGSTGDSYQTTINITFNPRYNITVVDRESRDRDRKIHRVITDAEHRAKHAVADFQRALEWDDDENGFAWRATPGGWYNNLQWRNPVIQTVGARNDDPKWVYRAPNDAVGNWYFHAMWSGIFALANNIEAVKLFIAKNGSPYRLLGYMNHDFSKHSKMQSTTVQGSAIVPIEPGDEISFMLQIFGAVGTGTLPDDGSYYSYVCGHRLMCTADHSDTRDSGITFNALPV